MRGIYSLDSKQIMERSSAGTDRLRKTTLLVQASRSAVRMSMNDAYLAPYPEDHAPSTELPRAYLFTIPIVNASDSIRSLRNSIKKATESDFSIPLLRTAMKRHAYPKRPVCVCGRLSRAGQGYGFRSETQTFVTIDARLRVNR